MAAPTVTQVMQGIQTRLGTISGLRTAAVRPDQLNPPFAYVSLPRVVYHEAFAHGLLTIEPMVTVVFSKVLDRIGQPGLAAYMDPAGGKSIHAAIEADKTLGGVVDDCYVVEAREADIDFGGTKWYAALFTLHVVAKGA